MTASLPLTGKIKRLIVILAPIIVTQLTLSAMNFVDTMMSGRFSPHDLAGVAIGASIWLPVFTGLGGILQALTPIVAQLAGAKQDDEIPRAVLQGIYIAIAIGGLVILVGSIALNPFLASMELENTVRHIAFHYLKALGVGVVALFVYMVLRSFMDALGQTRATMIITLTSLPINVFFNYVLIYGAWGFPRLGGVGAGYATAITYWLIALMALFVTNRFHPFTKYRIFSAPFKPHWPAWKEQLRIGMPMGLAIFFEVSIFSIVALLMSTFGTVAIAAHQAAMNFASLLYMIPLSISMALTIAVGFEVGAKRIQDAAQYSYIGLSASLSMALICALGLTVFNRQVAAMYTTDPELLRMIQSFLYYAIFFQLSDAIAAPIQGTLRGYKDVNAILGLSLVSYWIIGLPLGYVLASYTAMGPQGYWIGLISGLATGAIGLSWRLRRTQRRYHNETSLGEILIEQV